jgi:Flp pilus assembly secretin CpaC
MTRWCVISLVCLAVGMAVSASARQLAPAQTPAGVDAAGQNVVIKSQYRRLTFPQDIQRIAVGDTDILTGEVISSRELLLLGKGIGRTSLVIWFTNGLSAQYAFSVERDLSVLQRALKLINPTIEVESAPDRDALILTGTVPDESAKDAAETIAVKYLAASNGQVQGGAHAETAAGSNSSPNPNAPVQPNGGAPAVGGNAQTPAATSAASNYQFTGSVPTSGQVINLIQLTRLPSLPEDKIQDAIRAIGGNDVRIRRVQRGDVRDDVRDTLVLEGRVPNQIALVRVLVLAARLFANQTISADDIHVLADEGGALADQQQAQTQQSTLGGGGATSSLFGGARGARLTNQIRTNVGRAKAVEAANGQIISFIEVTDLPQVRVDIRLLEINRTKLKTFNPNSVLLNSDFRQPSLNPAQSATQVQGNQAARVGALGAAVQNVLSFLDGGLLNEFQYSGNGFAVDQMLAYLEKQGIAQTLSSPSLTVLSGELAQVQVGGEVPVPNAFAPAFGTATGAAGAAGSAAATPGVFSSVEFVPFGVQLQVRPLVGDDGTITLDVQPLVVTPDSVLTDSIRQSTGTAVATTAFQTRALRTSSRLEDGQALLIGGLMSNNTSTNVSSTPGIRNVPFLGRLFQSSNRNDQDTELVVVVNPVIVRAPLPKAATWSFPGRDEMIKSVMQGTR